MLAALVGGAAVTSLTVPSATSEPVTLEVQVDTGIVHGVTDGRSSEWRGIP